MVLVGQSAAQLNRGCSIQLGDDWVQSFRYATVTSMLYFAFTFPLPLRRRHKLTKLRRPTTDRRPLTDAQGAELEQWKLDYINLIQRPTEYGILLPPGHLQIGIPEELQLAVDESPLLYVPACKGTYEQHNCKTVYVFAQNDERQLTTSQVLQRSGQASFSGVLKRNLDLAAYCSIN